MKLAALTYTQNNTTMTKLFDDGSSAPVATDRHAEAIKTVERAGYRSFGVWINGPALAWSPTFETFIAAWGKPVLKAPCRYGRRSCERAHPVGNGYLVPTRSRSDIFRLRQDYPNYQGDLLMVPADLLYNLKVAAERQNEARQASINDWLESRRGQPVYELLGADFRPH